MALLMAHYLLYLQLFPFYVISPFVFPHFVNVLSMLYSVLKMK